VLAVLAAVTGELLTTLLGGGVVLVSVLLLLHRSRTR
jgi:hypothetical protein